MEYLKTHKDYFNNKDIHKQLLFFLFENEDPFTFYLDFKNDTIHYLIFGKKVKFIQLIFQKPEWIQYNNFDILEAGLQKKRIARNYLLEIDEIVQYNFILFPNQEFFDFKYWSFKDENHEFHNNYYMVYVLNLDFIRKRTDNKYYPIYQTLSFLFEGKK